MGQLRELVLAQVIAGKVDVGEAALLLGLSERSIRRLHTRDRRPTDPPLAALIGAQLLPAAPAKTRLQPLIAVRTDSFFARITPDGAVATPSV